MILKTLKAIALLPVLLAAPCACAQEQPNDDTNSVHVDLVRVYPNLRFDRPVFLTSARDGTNRIFVVEQAGVIRVFDAADDAEHTDLREAPVFLDISEKISRRGNEEGLLGLAFHPDYKTNGQFFVHYSRKSAGGSRNPGPGVIARYRVSNDDPNQADRNSEEVILTQRQPWRNHNGGMIDFGPDGYLYVTFGDGGSANDPEGNGQKLSTLLGSIIRIDVDTTDGDRAYGIPADNPFVHVDDARPEIFAYGLRNVWRFAFDRADGTLIAADVGQNEVEEINVIVPGGNYGWRRFEATRLFDRGTDLANGEHIEPVAEYGRHLGISVTGGYTYRGSDYPELTGSYFFGDYASGELWRMTEEDGVYTTERARRTGRSIASFGEDEQGEIYIVSFDGGIFKLIAASEPDTTYDDWPESLEDTGYFDSVSRQTIASNAIAYDVNVPFWSDGAEKSRYIILPDGEAMTYAEAGAWGLPDGTVIIKNFQREHGNNMRVLETRVIKKTMEGWEAATYVWQPNGRSAELQLSGQQFELWSRRDGIASWHAPSTSECSACHTDAAGFVLGLTTAQLNVTANRRNQIERWIQSGHLKNADSFNAQRAPRMHDPLGGKGHIEDRARAYLDVNCAMCHRPGGTGNAAIDLRYETALKDTGLINIAPAQGDLGLTNAKLIAPGAPESSVILERITTLGPGRMPNIGSNLPDQQAANLIRTWINSLPK